MNMRDEDSLILLNKITNKNFNNYIADSSNSTFLAPNGLVNIFNNENIDARMDMTERVTLTNKATDFRETVMSSYEETPLSKLFFSKENVDIIQIGIRNGVLEKSNNAYAVTPQNVNDLKEVMKSVYLQNAKDVLAKKPSSFSSSNLTDQISALNNIVVPYCVNIAFNEAVAYVKYMRDKSFLPVPLTRPLPCDRDYKDLIFGRFF